MRLFYPTFTCKRIYELTTKQLASYGVRGLVLDIDNTLTTHDNPALEEAVRGWLGEMKNAGIRLILLSNNHPPRVAPFAENIGLAFTADAKKPLPGGFLRAVKELNLPKEQVLVVGDQIFTDILGANWAGLRSVLVEPMVPETFWRFRFKRFFEKIILKSYRKKQGRQRQ